MLDISSEDEESSDELQDANVDELYDKSRFKQSEPTTDLQLEKTALDCSKVSR